MKTTDSGRGAGFDVSGAVCLQLASFSNSDRPTVRIAKSIAEVEESRQVWTSWHCHPSSDIDFYLTKIRESGLTLRPHVIVVCRNGSPDCMIVGRLDRMRMSLQIGYMRCFLPEARVLSFVRAGFLGKQSPENYELVVREIVGALQRGEADMAELKYVPIESPLYDAVRSAPGFLCRDHFPNWNHHGSLKLTDSFQSFLSGLSRKERHNLRRQSQLFLREFSKQVRIHCFQTTEEVERLIRDSEEVGKRTYQRALGIGFTDKLETRHQLLMAAKREMLRGYVMYIAEQPCAFMIGIQYQQTLHGLFMGFDPKFRRFSPGSFLLMHCLQESFVRKGPNLFSEIDLGPGGQRFKLTMSNRVWHEASVCIFAPTLKGVLMNFLRTMHVLIARLNGTLAETHLGKMTKRVWRSALSRKQTELLT